MATLLQLAELSGAVYGDPQQLSPDLVAAGWTYLMSSSAPSDLNLALSASRDGYLGVAYKNTLTGEIVIANRGTDLKNLSNFTNAMNVLSDIELAAGQKSPAQDDAAAFALDVANKNPGTPIIETGHSLGGSEAQAAVVALTKAGIPISGVTFNSPGIGGYPITNPASSYNVLNLSDQGDAIHLAGGTPLGSSALLQAGPNTLSLALATPLAITTGPIGIAALLGTALWDVVGPAHSIETMIGYLQNPTNTTLGNLTWTTAVNALPLIPGVPSNSTGPAMSVNSNGSLTLTDAGGNAVTFNTGAASQTVTATFTDGSGSGIYQELASLGAVTLPGVELNQNVAALTGAASINESVILNAGGTFNVAFNSAGSADQFAVTTANNGTSATTGFNYVVPTGTQTVVETIDNGDSSVQDAVSVIAGSAVTQLTGGTAVAGTDNTWIDGHGDQYRYNPDTGSMTISQGLLGTGGDQIVIDNFNLGQAESSAGYLGIRFGEQLAMTAGANSADDPFTNGGAYTAASQSATVAVGNVQTITLYAAAAQTTAQTVTLNGGGASVFVSTGADLLAFNGTLNLVIPAGQDHVTVGLVDTSNSSSPNTVNLTASMTDASGTVSSNALSVTFDSPNPDAGNTIPIVTPDNTILGDLQPLLDASGNYQYDSLGNLITDGVAAPNFNDTLHGSASGNDLIEAGGGNNGIAAGNGNDTISSGNGNDIMATGNGNSLITDGNGNDSIYAGGGNNTISGGSGQDIITAGSGHNVITGDGGQDVILTGNGANQIYAGQQTDLATALIQAHTATASGQKGDFMAVGSGANTLVGGAGNDAFILGGGNDLVIMGPGNDTLEGGTAIQSVGADWTTQNAIQTTSGITTYSDAFQNARFFSSGGYTGAAAYLEINTDSFGAALGGGSETILGGAGNDFITGSNGSGNYIDVGSGNSTVFGGAGNNTIFGGTGNSTIFGQAGNDYIVGESGNDLIQGGAGNNTIFGGSGADTISAGEGGLNWADLNLGNNYIDGGSGNSAIYGSGGNDTLLGGTGNATIYAGNGNQYVVGGSGNVSINGGSGNDTLDAGGNGNDIIWALGGTASIYGGGGSDTLIGGSGADLIMAGDGGTVAAPTLLTASNGTSTLYGGAGVDQLYGESGNDTLYAGSGTDTLKGGSGTEVMYGSIGNATLIAGSGADTLYGGSGTDLLQGGSSGNTLFVAGAGTETILGGSGSNTYQFNNGFGTVALGNTTGADTLEFGTGISLADLTVTATLSSNGAPALLIQTSGGGTLTIDGGLDGAINRFAFADGTVLSLSQLMAQGNTTPTSTSGANGNLLFSANGYDSLVGGAGNDTIYAWNSNNLLVAGSGNQLLDSQSGNDTLTAGTGNDTLVSVAGNDTMIGGTGNTTFVVNALTDTINAQLTGTNVNTVQSSVSYVAPDYVQNLTLTGTADITATGNSLNNTLTANSGNDTLIAGAGIATLVGGTGNDTFVVNNAADVIQVQSTGSNTNTVLSSVSYVMPDYVQNLTLTGTADLSVTGNSLNNSITANDGNDTLIAGAGLATLIGGMGNDTFVVNNAADVIYADPTGGNVNTVLSSVSYVEPNDVQNFMLTGTANLTATGNSTNSVITANSGNDTLIGNRGNGTLVGGSGFDTFVLGGGTGSYTAVRQASGNALMQLGQGLSFADVMAQQSGNDLVLGTGTGSNLRLSNYFLDPQAWSLQDAQGNTTTAQTLLADTAQAQSNIETQYLAQAYAADGQWLLADGYVQQPDGSWYLAPQLINSSNWYNDWAPELSVGTNTTVFAYATGVGPNSFGQSNFITLQNSNSWQFPNEGMSASNEITAYVQQSTLTLTDPVINLTGFSSSGVEITAGVKVNWVKDTSYPWPSDNYWQMNVSGYVLPDGSFSLYNSAGAAPVSGIETQTYQFNVYKAVPVTGDLKSSLTAVPTNFNMSGSGPVPQVVPVTYGQYQNILSVQQIDIGAGNHTIYGYADVVNGGSGDNYIQSAGIINGGSGNDTIGYVSQYYGGSGNDLIQRSDGTVYCGTGNDTITSSATVFCGSGNDTVYSQNDQNLVYGGSGNDLIQGAMTVVAGTGNETILGGGGDIGMGQENITINPVTSGMDLIGNSASLNMELDYTLLGAYYNQILGTSGFQGSMDANGSYFSGGLYYSSFYNGCFTTAAAATLEAVPGVPNGGYVTYNDPLPSLIVFKDGSMQPSPYYASANVPVSATFAANDFAALAPYFTNGTLPAETVTFDAGVSVANLHFSWGVVMTALSGVATDPQLRYTTLNMTWGVNQGIEVIIPHTDDPIGSGVQEFVFADGTRMGMADMIALAPPAPTFDPQILLYQLGMGAQTLAAGYSSIQFGAGISSAMVTLGVGPTGALLLRVGAGGDVITIPQFDPTHADQQSTSLQSFNFADGTSLDYAQLLTRGFDIYGTTGNESLTGTNLDNRIYAGTGNDTLIGSGANDTLIASAGLATLIGGAGNETFVVNNAADIIQAQATGANTNTVLSSVSYVMPANVQSLALTGTADLTATGNDINNTLTANSGNDTLIAGAGVATLVGGSGNDTFVVNNAADMIQAQASGANTNTVLASVSYVAPANVQNLTLTGTADLTATGNTLANTLTANAGNDTLIAGSGNDTLIAGAGVATMIGGSGNDTFVVNNVNDVVQAQATSTNMNTVLASVSYVAPANVQNLTLTGTADLTATGNTLANTLTANAGNDTLMAGSGNDTLIAGAGLATLVGGTGNDTFVVNNVADVIQAQATGANTNTVLSSVSYTAPANVQNITLTGSADLTVTGNALNNVITANSGNDTLIAGSSNATLIGGAGVDTFVFNQGGVYRIIDPLKSVSDIIQFGPGITSSMITLGLGSLMLRVGTSGELIHIMDFDPTHALAPNAIQTFKFADGTSLSYDQLLARGFDIYGTTGNETLSGTNLNNRIYAGSGNDVLIGIGANDTLTAGAGIDTLIGGAGNETFVVNSSADLIVAAANAASNTIEASFDYVAPANVQNITLTGTANLTATGNTLNNTLTANAGNDTLMAGSGNDTLIAGAGLVTMIGGSGNDTFIVNNADDVIEAQSTGTNTNTVLSSVSYVAPANVQNITLTGTADLTATGNTLNNAITANSGNDTLIAGAGLATLVGGAGNDTFVVNNAVDVIQAQATGNNTNTVLSSVSYVAPANVQNITLTGTADLTATGNSLNNVITANSGNDTLIAGAGLATLVGGSGNDTFAVNDARDVVQALATGTSINTVLSSVDYVAPANVQNITLTGTADLTATGNSLNNVITANSGNDTLIAGAGLATLVGGSGNDTFVIDNAADVIQVQSTGANTSTVLSSVDYVAPANVQNITLTGSADLTATGNTLDNTLTANAGNDTLIAGSGNDTLIAGAGLVTMIGGSGNDTFVINNVNDVVQAKSTGANTNTVLSSVSYVAPDHVQNITLTGSADLTATGNQLDNVIAGNAGNDTLIGGSGNDTLIAGAGLATLIGGTAGNTFVVDNVNDRVVVNSPADAHAAPQADDFNPFGPGLGGLAALLGVRNLDGGSPADSNRGPKINTVLASVNYVLPTHVQRLTLTGSADLTATGNDQANILTANSGNDTLIAGAGLSLMIGGSGNDTFVVNDARDVVQAQSTGANTNTILSSVNYVAPANVQNVTLTGTANLTATGNSLNNVITANSGNDTLIAGAGPATLIGGAGNDTFIVNNADDVIEAQSTGTNTNTVFSSVSYVMPAHVQHITLTGNANLTATGNSLDNVIVANRGNDTLVGGTGAAILIGGAGRNVLTDTMGQAILLGGDGNDTLTGGAANDFIVAGRGNEVISAGTTSSVVAFNRGAGQDTLTAGAGGANTLSLGSGIDMNSLMLSKHGNDLVLSTGGDGSITFQGWYASNANRDFTTLQMIGQQGDSGNALGNLMLASDRGSSVGFLGGYAYSADRGFTAWPMIGRTSGGSLGDNGHWLGDLQENDRLSGNKINEFDFAKLVALFDQARANDPALSDWHVMDGLLNSHLSGSDTAALGGDLAYYYGLQGSLSGMSLAAAQSTLQSPQFGVTAQTIHSWTSIDQGAAFSSGTGH